jgi:hypothetical protein
MFSHIVRQTLRQQQLSTQWRLGCSAAAALIICFTGLNLFLTRAPKVPKVEWMSLPPHDFINERSGPAIRSNQDGGRNYRFGHAFADPKQPIFTRIAAISPALVALPHADSDKSPESTAAKEPGPESLAETGLPENTVSFAGVWAPTANACTPRANSRDLLPAIINQEGAWAGDVSCRFRRIRQSGNAAVVTSTCSDGRQRWTAKVRLARRRPPYMV